LSISPHLNKPTQGPEMINKEPWLTPTNGELVA